MNSAGKLHHKSKLLNHRQARSGAAYKYCIYFKELSVILYNLQYMYM